MPDYNSLEEGGQQEQHGFDIRSLLHVLLEKAWLIILCFVVVLLLTGGYLMNATKIYQSQAVIEVESQEDRVVQIEKVQESDLRSLEVLRTIEQNLQSRSLLDRVIETNKFVGDPRFTDSDTGEAFTKDQIVESLSRMTDAKLRRGTRLIDVTVSSPDPQFCKLVANSLITEFMRRDLDDNVGSSQMASQFLADEAERLKVKLEASEQALQKYKEQTKSVSLEDKQNVIVQRLKELSLKVTEAKSARIRLQSEHAQIAALGTNIEALLTVPAVANDPNVSAIVLTLSKAEADFATLQKRYRPKHPDYIASLSQIAEWTGALRQAVVKVPETVKAAYESALASENAMVQAQREQEEAALELNKLSIQYNVLAREVDTDKTLYESVLQRMKETSLTAGLTPTKVRVREWAFAATKPIKPAKLKILVLGVFGGLALGIMMALFVNGLDTSVRTVDQAEEYFGLPVLSVIPQAKEMASRAKGESAIVMAEQSMSAIAEAFRSLRTSLSMLGREEKRRVFLLTSALPEEGKTTCSVNLSASFAQSGLRTLLIDGDLRRPSVEKSLGLETNKPHPGVSDCLAGKSTLLEVVRPTKLENLNYVPAGTTAPNPAELLAHNGFDAILEEAMLHFDRIIVDSAPIHAVSDTLTMLAKVQTVCLVVRACKTPRKSSHRAVHLLQKGGAPLAGIILNRMPRRRGLEYYYDPYYDYGYRGKHAPKGVYGNQ